MYPNRRVLPGLLSSSRTPASTAAIGYSWARKAEPEGFQAHMDSRPVSSPWQCPGRTLPLASLNVYVCQCSGCDGLT